MKKSLRRNQILRNRRDFEKVRHEGKRINGRLLACNYLCPGASENRAVRMAAFIVPKSCGPAVVRNKIRRRIKEIYRHLQGDLPEGLWSVWIARKGAAKTSYWDLKAEIERIYRKAELLPVLNRTMR